MRCKVEGCNRQLDHNGHPVEYCDYQQGRCPMQKQTLSVGGHIFLAIILLAVLVAVWSII